MRSRRSSQFFCITRKWLFLGCLLLFTVGYVSAVPGTVFFGAFGEYEYTSGTSWSPDLGAYGFYSHRIFLSDNDYLSIQSSLAADDLINGAYDTENIDITYDRHFDFGKLSVSSSLTTSIIDAYLLPEWSLEYEHNERRNSLTPFGGYEGSYYFDALAQEHSISHTLHAGAEFSPKIERSYRSWVDAGYTDYVWSSRRDITVGLHEHISGFLGYLVTWDMFIDIYYNFSTDESAQAGYGAVKTEFAWSPHLDITLSLMPELSAAYEKAAEQWIYGFDLKASADYALTEYAYLFISPRIVYATGADPRFEVSGGFDLSLL